MGEHNLLLEVYSLSSHSLSQRFRQPYRPCLLHGLRTSPRLPANSQMWRQSSGASSPSPCFHEPVGRMKMQWCEGWMNSGKGAWCVYKARKLLRPMTLATTSSESWPMLP